VLYLGNPCASDKIIAAMCAGKIGLLDQPRQRNRTAVATVHAAGGPWAADNGAFTASWKADEWWAWLQRQTEHAGTCLFATAPDVVADAAATWERSRPWLDRIRGLGFPVAYVGQDGLTELPWGDFDVLFLGGTDQWKLGPEAARWATSAVERGVPVHCGRVNSHRRYVYAMRLGCSTADGTYLRFGPDVNLPNVLAWSRSVEQPDLF